MSFRFAVYYDGIIIGTFRVDLLVDGRLLVEVKAEPALTGVHGRQLRNYLSASEYEVGLLLGYGIKLEHMRIIHTRNLKKLAPHPWPLPSNPSDPCATSEPRHPRPEAHGP